MAAMRAWTALLALGLGLPAARAEPPATATPAPGAAAAPQPPGLTAAPALDGEVVSLDLQRHRAVVETAAGRVEVAWDRNTLIYRPGGATSPTALQPGAVVRAALDPAGTAYWIQLRPPPPGTPAPTPGR
jgi:hypothetical protein